MGKRISRRSVAPRELASSQQLPGQDVAGKVAGVSRLGAIGKESVLSRGKRKRSEKRARVERKQDFIDTELRRLEAEAGSRRAAIASRISQRQGKSSALSRLDTLAKALSNDVADKASIEIEDDMAKAGRPVQKVVHEKARRQILAAESVQVRNVLEHPSYQADPMEALRQHLMNTVQDDPLAVPESFGPTPQQKLKQKKREERKGSVALNRKKDSGKSVSVRDASARKKEAKSDLAAKARSGRIKKNARSVERVQALGRIGVPRPKLSSANRKVGDK